MVDIFKALADENRTRIVNLLVRDNLCVGEMEIMLKLNQSNLSRHLNKLKAARIIESKKEAQWVYYQLKDSFYKENRKLIDYLKERFEKEEIYIEDHDRYKKYKEKGFTCQCITNDKDEVISSIN